MTAVTIVVSAVPLVVCVVGALLYFAFSGKVSEVGRIAFFVGLFWLVCTMRSMRLG